MIRSFHLTEAGEVRTDLSPEEIRSARESGGTLWVDLFRPSRQESELLSGVFHFHPLAVDDCMRPAFRPRVEAFEDHLFLIVNGPDLASREPQLRTLEMDAFLGRNFLVTVHQVPLRSILNTTQQCERAPAGILGRGADFLLYSILNEMAENYSPGLSRAEAQVAQIEEQVLKGEGGDDVLPELMRLRRDLLKLRRVIMAQRDAVNLLAHQSAPLVTDRAKVYFRDVVDLYRRVLEVIEIQRDALSGARDTFLSMLSNRTNEIMKTLTIIATIMLPPTVVASIYGMNFLEIPEFKWGAWGYVWSLGLMAAISGGLLYYFRRKKWI